MPFCVKDKKKVYIIYLYYKFNRKCKAFPIKYHEAAEGIFTLDHIEEIEHAYLFESDRNWIKALEATFHPWRDKITIIPKYVSNENTDMSVSLDKLVHDIEGAELMALEGCRKTLSDSNVRISVCTYHKKEDEKVIGGFLESLGYRLIKSGRLIYLGSYKHSDVPFFRLGVLYAVK